MSLLDLLWALISLVTIGLIGVVWWLLLRKIEDGDRMNSERILDLDKRYGVHDSKINDRRAEFSSLQTKVDERSGEINRRFEEFRFMMKDIDAKLERLLDRRLEERAK